MRATIRRLAALAVTAFMVWTTGCGIETQVMGITADADIARPELMPKLAHGANLELSHVFLQSTALYLFSSIGTDEMTDGYNSSSTYRRYAVNQYQNRPDVVYSQAHEAGWVAAYAAERMYDVNVEYGTNPDTDPLIAHMYVNAALNMETMAEAHCVACINWGPQGGNLLKGKNPPYDLANPVDSDSIMKHAIAWALKAETVATAAVAAGRTNEIEPTWEHFIPQNSLHAARAILARGYLWLKDYAKADEYAAKVPINFVWNLYSNVDNSWRQEWVYLAQRYALVTVWGSAIATTFKDVVDPRIPWVSCGEYKPGLTVGGRSRSSSEYVNYTSRAGCATSEYNYSGRYRTYDNDLPNYLQLKFTSYDQETPLVTGTEMKLIRAEVALRGGNLGAFAGFVNDVRGYYNVAPIQTPATAGALEYPNAQDDGWSILDREKLFTNWLEGRRHADFRRWQHPFWTGHNYKTPDEELDNAGLDRPQYKRGNGEMDWCLPLPDGEECDVNPYIRTTAWCETLYAPGESGG